MKVQVLKYKYETPNLYWYEVLVYDGVLAGIQTVGVPKYDLLTRSTVTVLQEELDRMAANKIRRDKEQYTVQSIVGKIFHW